MRINCLQPATTGAGALTRPGTFVAGPLAAYPPAQLLSDAAYPRRPPPRNPKDFPGRGPVTRRATGRERTAGRSILSTYGLPYLPTGARTACNGLMDIFEYLKQAGGAARTAQLLSAGYSRRDIGQLTDLGATQPRRGVFLAPGCDPDLAAAIRHNARLTCASAAARYGLWLRNPPPRLHLACNHGHGNGFVRHRTLRFDGHPDLPLAAVEDVTLHALGCLAPPSSTAMATSAIRLHGVHLELLKDQLRGDRSAPVRRALQDLDLRAESIVEVDAQHLFRTNGIDFDAQVFLPGIGRVDFLLDQFLIVEIDGFAFHSQRADMLRDRDRNNTSTVQGFAVLRYMPEHIWFNPDHVLAEIRAVLAGRKGQGTSTRAFQPS
jgi:very-short-patch-repair endonuclease